MAYAGVGTPAGTSGSAMGAPATMRRGISPPQIGSTRSSASSIGPPVRTFAEASEMGMRTTSVARSSASVGGRGVGASSRDHVIDDRVDGSSLFVGIVDPDARAEDDNRPVVHRVVKRGSSQHECVGQSDRHTKIVAAGDRAQDGVSRRAVEIDVVVNAAKRHRDDDGSASEVDRHVTEKGLVEDGADGGYVVVTTVGLAPKLRSGGDLEFGRRIAHDCTVPDRSPAHGSDIRVGGLRERR